MGDVIFPQYEIASWTVGGRRLAFPVQTIDETGGNRIIRRTRPYRRGAKLDSTGGVERVWDLSIFFEPSINEPGLEANGIPLYPDLINALIESFDVQETGSLVVPTIGRTRAKAESYRRGETFEDRDSATLTLVFVEDNEDSVNFRTIQAPSAAANSRDLGEQTTFDTQSVDSWAQSMADLERTSAELEDLINTPSSTASEIERRSDRMRDLADNATRIFRQRGKTGRNTYEGPRASRTERKLIRMDDIAGRARLESRSEAQSEIVSVIALVPTSLIQVAGELRQELADVIDINPDVDPLFVPKGSVLRIRLDEATAR